MAHPYYPVDALIPNFVANNDPISVTALQFIIGLNSILGLVGVLVRYIRPTISRRDLLTVFWFSLCTLQLIIPQFYSVLLPNIVVAGTLHCIFEGYFVTHYNSIAQSQNIFAQLWKEYALSDSRYLSSDTFVL